MGQVDPYEVRRESARERDSMMNMGSRSLLEIGGAEGVSIPANVRRNESLEPGDELECYYDPVQGAIVFYPGGDGGRHE